MNLRQTWIVRIMLVSIAVLALFPPHRVTTWRVSPAYSAQVSSAALETTVRHQFVAHRGGDLVLEFADQPRTHFDTQTVDLSALLCELLAITALGGLAFLSVKHESN